MYICVLNTYHWVQILLPYGSSHEQFYKILIHRKTQAMKKLLLVFLALGSMFALSACPDSGDGGEAATTETTTETHSEEGGSGH